jgi:uncharacterized protein YceK
MKNILVLLATMFLLSGCSGFAVGAGAQLLAKYMDSRPRYVQMSLSKQRQCIRNHQFVIELSPKAFLKEWGKPDRQGIWDYTVRKGYCVTEWNNALKYKKDLEIAWVYENRPDDEGRILFFYENRLMSSLEWNAYQKREGAETLPNDEIKESK